MKPHCITTLVGDDVYVFRFRPDRIDEVADKLYEFVHNPELNMNWGHADEIYALHLQPILEAQARLNVWDLARATFYGLAWLAMVFGPWSCIVALAL